MATGVPRYSPLHTSANPPDAKGRLPRLVSPVESTVEPGSCLVVLQRVPDKTKDRAFLASTVVYA